MKNQIWFKTNLNYHTTLNKIHKSQIFAGQDEWKGKYSFYFRDIKNVIVQITTNGFLSITYPEEENWEAFLKRLKPFLIKDDGTLAENIVKHKELPESKKSAVKIEEADQAEILEWLKIIRNKKELKEEVLRGIRRLHILTEKKKRIANQPDVILALEECLENTKNVDDPKIFQELARLLRNILRLEREIKNQESDKIIERITDGILDKVINSVKRKSEFPGKYTIEFLAECKKEAVVQILFWLIHKFKHELSRNQVEMVGVALRDSLYSEHRRIINQKIRGLNRSEDEELLIIAKTLSEITSWA